MQDRKMLFLEELLPLEERGSFNHMASGLLILALGAFLLYSGNRYAEHLAEHLTERNFEVALYCAAFGLFVHGAQVFLLLLGWVLIGQGAGNYFRRGELLANLVLSSAGIWASWTIPPLFSGYLQVVFPLNIFFVVMLTVLFQLLTLNIEEGTDKGVAMLLWVYSFQSLELLPALPPYNAEFSISISTPVPMPVPFPGGSPRTQRDAAVAAMAGTALFLSFTMGASLSTWLLAKYSLRLSRVRRLWRYEPLQDREDEGIRQVSMVDVHNLVHDLKNPLAAVKTTAMMLREDPSGNGAPEKIRIMLAAAGYMERIVEEILHEQRRQAVPVRSFFESLEQHVRPFPWGGEVNLSLDPDAAGAYFSVNGIRLTRALLGVLDNAWRANRSAGARGIELRVRRNVRFLEIEILDNGPGYAPKGPGRSGWGSTGLGLAFARRVVAAHGGGLVISRRADANGTSVFISLPAADSQDAANSAAGRSAAGSAS
ncbi:MAG: HAMP domain-containing histidine kinase [Synergistaceae bacterium]|jgi:signal transduction histidine kinase|nr:HAMP domain-containing histidine kinase [Synergistaceae bacterium]